MSSTERRQLLRGIGWLRRMMRFVVYGYPLLMLAFVLAALSGLAAASYGGAYGAHLLAILAAYWPYFLIVYLVVILLFQPWLRKLNRSVHALCALYETLDAPQRAALLREASRKILIQNKMFYCGGLGVWLYESTIRDGRRMGPMLLPYGYLAAVRMHPTKKNRLLLYSHWGEEFCYHARSLGRYRTLDGCLQLLRAWAPWALEDTPSLSAGNA